MVFLALKIEHFKHAHDKHPFHEEAAEETLPACEALGAQHSNQQQEKDIISERITPT